MKIFLVTVGIVAILVFVLLLLFYITLLRRGERYIAEIVEVNEGNSFGKATYRHTLRVRFIYQGSEREVETLTAFSSFFFSKKKTIYQSKYGATKKSVEYQKLIDQERLYLHEPGGE